MTMGSVLDPSVVTVNDNPDSGPTIDDLSGKTIGFRIDILWRSWDWVADEWAQLARADGAEVKMWRSGGRVGAEAEEMDAGLNDLIESSDVCIVGLGNCGSCTSWTIHDALRSLNADVPTVAVVTEHFEDLGRTLARRGGRSGLRLEVLPYPFDIQPEEEVRDIAKQHYRQVMRALGVSAGLAQQPAA